MSKTLSQKQIKLYEKEIEKIRHEIDKILSSPRKNEGSKYNWSRIDHLVDVNILLDRECNQ